MENFNYKSRCAIISCLHIFSEWVIKYTCHQLQCEVGYRFILSLWAQIWSVDWAIKLPCKDIWTIFIVTRGMFVILWYFWYCGYCAAALVIFQIGSKYDHICLTAATTYSHGLTWPSKLKIYSISYLITIKCCTRKVKCPSSQSDMMLCHV